jgi:hypothetical protein
VRNLRERGSAWKGAGVALFPSDLKSNCWGARGSGDPEPPIASVLAPARRTTAIADTAQRREGEGERLDA